MQAGCQGAFSGQGDDKEVDRTIAGESGAEHAGRMSPSRTGGVDRPRGGCRDLFAPPQGSLPSPDGSSPCEGGLVCAGHCRLPVSGHISPSPPGVCRSCCRLCWRLGLALLTQSPAKGPECPAQIGTVGITSLETLGTQSCCPGRWGGHAHLTITCACAPHLLALVSRIPTAKGTQRMVHTSKSELRGEHSFVLKTVSAPPSPFLW